MLIGMVQLDTNMKEDVAKRLIDQQVAPLMENIPSHFLVNFSPDMLSFDCIFDVIF